MAESEAASRPRLRLPVFDTDFRPHRHPQPAGQLVLRTAPILRIKGAEIILFPWPATASPTTRRRPPRPALDNGVYLVALPTLNAIPARIITPAGGILAEAAGHSISPSPKSI